jgi:antitoxin Phd
MPRGSKRRSPGGPQPERSARRPDGALTPASAGGAVTSTEAQNNFGRVLTRAIQEGIVYITKYGTEAAVVLSIDRFRALVPNPEPNLDALTAEFQAMVARMQTPGARVATDALFAVSSDDLAEAAVQQASKRKTA